MDLNKPLGPNDVNSKQMTVFSTPAEALSSLMDPSSLSDPVEAALAKLLNTAIQNEVVPWYKTLVMDTKPAIDEIR